MAQKRLHKRKAWQDNFIKHWCKSSHNHPEGWRWWKQHTRKQCRLQEKKEMRHAEEI